MRIVQSLTAIVPVQYLGFHFLEYQKKNDYKIKQEEQNCCSYYSSV